MKRAKYNALYISQYIINYCNDKEIDISNLKLQKLLYFIQAKFLYEKGEPCFVEKIQAWKYGPVVPEVYHEYKNYGSMIIDKIDYVYQNNEISWDNKYLKFDDNEITFEDKKYIAEVCDVLSNISANSLVDITHSQRPWIDAYEKHVNNIITNDSIISYFKEINDENV